MFVAAILCGADSCFHTVHFHSCHSILCLFLFSHRTVSFQLFCTVLIPVSVPYTFLPAILCGTVSRFCTIHFPSSFSIRCHFSFSYRTFSFQPFCTVTFSVYTPYTFLLAISYGVISHSHAKAVFFFILIIWYKPEFTDDTICNFIGLQISIINFYVILKTFLAFIRVQLVILGIL